MKIAVISPNPHHLADIGGVLQAHAHTPLLFEGGKSRMQEVAEREEPELMLVDGICCDTSELAQVEYVTTHHPGTAVILLCSTHTPDFLISSMRAGVREVLPSPAAPDVLVAAIDRIASKLTRGTTSRQGKVLAFTPCKGGAGATFLATNVAWMLAESNSVLLVDLDLQFGDAATYVHDGVPTSTLADVARDITRLDASLLGASTLKVTPRFSLLAAPEELSQAMEIKPEHVAAILALAVRHYDFVVLDVGRVMDPIAVRAFDTAWRVYPVMQQALADVRHARRMLDAFRSLGYPSDKSEVIVNRFDKGGEIGLDQIQRSLGGVHLRTVANSFREVSNSVNHGDAIGKSARNNPVARQLAELAQALSPHQEGSRSLLDRFFRRA